MMVIVVSRNGVSSKSIKGRDIIEKIPPTQKASSTLCPAGLTCSSQKSGMEERRSNDSGLLHRGGKEADNEGQESDYDSYGGGKMDNWDKNGARDAREWYSESSDSDRPNPPRRPYFDDSEDSDAFENYDPGEYRGKNKPYKVAASRGYEHTSQHPSQCFDTSLAPPKKGGKVDKNV